MATKFTPKKNKVTGTKKKDKIVWQNKKAWKKALTVNAGKGNDTIDFKKSKYKNTLNGEAGNDVIYGGKKADTINGGAGNDKITGGKGNDVIYTGAGKDIIYVNKGDGKDTIYHQGKKTTIQVNGANKKDKVASFVKQGNDLIMTYQRKGVKLSKSEVYTLKGFFNADGTIKASSKNIYLKNKKTQKVVDLLNKQGFSLKAVNGEIRGSYKSETINGTNGNDKLFGLGGNDKINGGSGNDKIYGGAGNDIINAGTGNNTIYLNKKEGTDTIVNGGGVDTLVFTNETDFKNLTFAYNGNDLKISANGTTAVLKDYKLGGHSAKYVKIGNNTYDVSNVIISSNERVDGTSDDDIIIANDTTKYIIATQGGNDTICSGSNTGSINLGTGNNTVYVQDRLNNNSPYVYLNTGNDTIYTTETKSAYLYVTGSSSGGQGPENGGNDTIYWRGGDTSLLFYKTDYADIIFTRENGSDDLVLRYGENNSVTLKGYYKAGNEGMANLKLNSKNEPEIFSSNWPTLAQMIENKNGVKTIISGVTGTDADEYIIGSDEDEIISGGNGHDIINPKGGTDEIHLGEGNDMLFAGSGNKTIFADGGNNTINLGTGVNYVTLGTGEDTISTSSTGHYKITFVEGDSGNDTFIDNGATGVLEFKENTFDQLLLDSTGDELVIKRGFGDNPIMVTLLNTETNNDKILIYSNSGQGHPRKLFDLNTVAGHSDVIYSQTLSTGSGNDSIYTGLGNDNIIAGKGNNCIQLEIAESGNNNTYTYAEGADEFYINGLADLNGLMFMQTNEDLIIAYKDGDFAKNTLTIKGYYADDSTKNIQFGTRNGDSWVGGIKLENLMSSSNTIKILSCTEDNHTINASEEENGVNIEGCAEDDVITGSNYADVINGYGGNDIINGGSGDDMYIFDSDAWGSGQTVITDSAGDSDTLRINTTSDKINLFFDVTQNDTVTNGNVGYTIGNDLYINSSSDYTFANAKTSNGIKITDYFTDDGKIENVAIPNGNDWLAAFDERTINIVAQNVANWLKTNGYTSTTDAIEEGKQADLIKYYKPIISSNEGVNGTDGDDIIIANDTTKSIIATQGGNDTIYSGSNTGSIYLGKGNNTVYVQDRLKTYTPYVYLNTGNDTIYTTETKSAFIYVTGSSSQGQGPENGGNDTIYWRGGNTALLFNKTNFANITCSKSDNDLVLSYGENNSVTLKDYYKSGNEGMAGIELSANNRPEMFSSSYPTLNEIIAYKGGVGDDIYSANINDIWYKNYTINDKSGSDTLNINNNKNSIYIMFNVKNDGNFAEGNDKIYFGNNDCNATWKTTGMLPDKPAYKGCIQINGFDSIETIKTSDGYKIADLSQLKSDVAAWLSKDGDGGNGVANYNDVADALTNGTTAVTEGLANLFNRDTNWQTV